MKNLGIRLQPVAAVIALSFSLLSGIVAVVRWVDSLERRIAVVEARDHYYHGLDNPPDGD